VVWRGACPLAMGPLTVVCLGVLWGFFGGWSYVGEAERAALRLDRWAWVAGAWVGERVSDQGPVSWCDGCCQGLWPVDGDPRIE
jgi:hypothetical protein